MTITEIQQRIPENANFINKYFLVCTSCLWFASTFYDNIIGRCPLCDCTNLHMIPICINDVFPLDYNPTNGLSVEFRSTQEEGRIV